MASSCTDAVDNGADTGVVRVKLAVDASAVTRAESGIVAPEVADFDIEVASTDGEYTSRWESLTELTSDHRFEVGEYLLTATCGDVVQEGFDKTAFAAFPHVLSLSATTGDGIAALSDLVKKLFTDETLRLGEEAILSSARQYAALTRAKEHLATSLYAFQSGMPADAAASDLELAIGALADLDGRAVNDEIIGGNLN